MEEKYCLECSDPIVGRIDKKFCSDQCRNSYNNKLNSDSVNSIRNINNRLRKNRRILLALNPEGKTKITKEKMLKSGFDFKFHTHLHVTQKGNTYIYCYDQGYLLLEDDFVLLITDKKTE